MAKTRLSSKGQVIIPKPVRDRHGWREGTVLEVDDSGDAVILRASRPFPHTAIEDVRGCLAYRGPRLSLEQMDEAVRAEARRRR
jgi:AbrB family looped-hinge helix DNA binding protein